MKRLHAGMVWLSAIGGVLGAILLYLWRRGSLNGGGWVHVSCVDKDGNPVGEGEWHRFPKPDKIKRHGLSHVARYVTRLVSSPAPLCSLIIAAPDGNRACLIMRDRRDGRDGSHLTVRATIMLGSSLRLKKGDKGPDLPPAAPEPEKEAALRKLFTELRIAPDKDFVHEYNGYADAVRELHYPIVNEVSQATKIIQRLLREVYHFREEDGLHFTVKEN